MSDKLSGDDRGKERRELAMRSGFDGFEGKWSRESKQILEIVL